MGREKGRLRPACKAGVGTGDGPRTGPAGCVRWEADGPEMEPVKQQVKCQGDWGGQAREARSKPGSLEWIPRAIVTLGKAFKQRKNSIRLLPQLTHPAAHEKQPDSTVMKGQSKPREDSTPRHTEQHW